MYYFWEVCLKAIVAIACGLPLLTSNFHGINDYSIYAVTGYKCDADDVCWFANEIKNNNVKQSRKYEVDNINLLIESIYKD